MIQPFDSTQGPVLVSAEIAGPLGKANLWLVLDTGATQGLIGSKPLADIGLIPSADSRFVSVAMGNSVGSFPLLIAPRLKVLGRNRLAFPVLAHTLPVEANVDGLLGLDFLREQILTIDFPAGRISLT